MSGAGLTIRDARPEDRPTLVRMMAALQAFEAAIETNRAEPGAMAEPHFAALERWALAPFGGVFIALEAAAPVGFAVCGACEEEVFVAPAHRTYGRISDLYVEASARGRGVGRRLIAACEARLRSAGVARVEISALAANQDAIAAYEACGYRPSVVSLERYLDGPEDDG